MGKHIDIIMLAVRIYQSLRQGGNDYFNRAVEKCVQSACPSFIAKYTASRIYRQGLRFLYMVPFVIVVISSSFSVQVTIKSKKHFSCLYRQIFYRWRKLGDQPCVGHCFSSRVSTGMSCLINQPQYNVRSHSAIAM